MLETIKNALSDAGISNELIIFIISLFPILELRGGLIVAAMLGVPIWKAAPICIVGNLMPIPFILLFIRKILSVLKKTKLFKPIVEWVERKADKKKDKITKYAKWGLYLFVALPIPGTGAWMGALLADILDIHINKSFPMIVAGVLTACAIMVALCYGAPEVFNVLIGR